MRKNNSRAKIKRFLGKKLILVLLGGVGILILTVCVLLFLNLSKLIQQAKIYEDEVSQLLADNNIYYENLEVSHGMLLDPSESFIKVRFRSDVPYDITQEYKLDKIQDSVASLVCPRYSEYDRILINVTTQTNNGLATGARYESPSYSYSCKTGELKKYMENDGEYIECTANEYPTMCSDGKEYR